MHTHTHTHSYSSTEQTTTRIPPPCVRLQSSAKFGAPIFLFWGSLRRFPASSLCIFSVRDGSFKTEKRATLGRTSLWSVCIQIHYTEIHLSKKGDKKDSDRNNFSFAWSAFCTLVFSSSSSFFRQKHFRSFPRVPRSTLKRFLASFCTQL